jgi:phosphonate transport system ATP-binding protein
MPLIDSIPAITCQDLSITYKNSRNRPILNKINCQINQGEFVAVLGLNGAGKSTWLRSLAGLVRFQQGTLHILGHAAHPRRYDQIRQHLGMIAQGGRLIPQLSVLDNVLCGCLGRYSSRQTLGGFPAHEHQRAHLLLQELGLTEKSSHSVRLLSGGQQQRVAIARALMQNASILLADEPTSGLDVLVAKQVMDILFQLNQTQGLTILVVLHDLEMAIAYAQRAIILDHGQIFYDGPTYNLRDKFAELQPRSSLPSKF